MQVKIWKVGVLWAFVLVLVVGIYSATYALGPRPVRVVVEGTTLNVSSQVINGRLMVPYRAVAERLGARVGWNAAERSVTVTDGDTNLKLTVGQANAVSNGRKISLDVAPVLLNGRVLVPLRFLGTSLGWRVSWEDATRTARLNSIPDLTVRVAVPDGVPALSIIRLLRERPSMGRNVTITYEVVRSPELMAARVISGEADIAIVPTNLAAVLYNRNVPYKLAAANVWGMLHVVSSENIPRGERRYGEGKLKELREELLAGLCCGQEQPCALARAIS